MAAVGMTRCAECRYGFDDEPDVLAQRCQDVVTYVRGVLSTTGRAQLLRRPAPTVWSPLEYAAHIGEAVGWYVARVQKVLAETDPQLEALDWDRAAIEGRYQTRPTAVVAEQLQASCDQLAHLARSCGTADLARTGVGSDGSPRTVRVLLARAGHELVHHQLDIYRGIGLTENQ